MLTIGGSVVNDIIVEGAITGDITIAGLLEADISCDAMEDLTVTAGTANAPTITIRGPYADFIYIRDDSVPGTLGRLEIQGQLSGWATILGDLGGAEIDAVTGALTVETDLTGDLEIYGDVVSAYDTGGVRIHGAQYGNVHLAGTLRGVLFAGAGVVGNITLDEGVDEDGWIIARGAGVSGDLEIRANMGGTINVLSDYGISGDVRISGSLTGLLELWPDDEFGNLEGSLEIGQGLSGTVYVANYVRDVNQDLSGGHIIINGPLEASGRIEVGAGFSGSTEFIVADFDGIPKEDLWEPGALVTVGGVEYGWDNQVPRILESRCSKGDLNNDNQVDNDDIDAFVLALTDEAAYALAYPGMSGSREYHGNCNCQDGFNNFDIDAFTLRLTDWETYRCVYPNCDPCLGPCTGGAEGLGAQPVGELYKKSVAPERLPYVIDTAEFLASWYKGTPRGKFWADVHAALVK